MNTEDVFEGTRVLTQSFRFEYKKVRLLVPLGDIVKVLDKHGDKRWELVTVIDVTSCHLLIFKRAVIEEDE